MAKIINHVNNEPLNDDDIDIGASDKRFKKGYFVDGIFTDITGTIISATQSTIDHNSLDNLDSLDPSVGEYFHVLEQEAIDLIQLTNGSNSDSLHVHHYVDRDFVNGTFFESFDCVATSDGSIITARLIPADNPSIDDLTMQFSDGDTILETPVSIVLTAGLDTAPETNYIYIPKDTKVLTKSTSGFPTDEHIKVSFFFVPSAIEVQSEGPFITQNWNDHIKNNEIGHLSHITERIRYSRANYFSGLNPNGSDQDTNSSYFDFVSASESYFKMTSGIVYQMHRHSFVSFDSQQSSDDIHVINWNGTAYRETSNIADIVDDSAGIGLDNKYFNLFFFAVGNKMGTYNPVMCVLPSGSYRTQTSAENDVDGFDNLTMPREFALDSSTGVPICRMTLKWSGGTTTLNHISTTDLRSSGIIASGGGTGSLTDFADNQFDIFNVDDITKIINFDAGTISTSTTRTYIFPDANGTLLLANTTQNFTTTGLITIDSNTSRLFLGENQEASIYFDGDNLNIGIENPSLGNLSNAINFNDDVNILGNLNLNNQDLLNPGTGHDDFTDYVSTEHLDSAFDLDDSLVSWWRMDEVDSGDQPTDFNEKNDVDTTIGSPVQVDDGIFGKCFEFGGIPEKFKVTFPTDLPLGSASRTVVMRVKTTTGDRYVFHYGDGSGAGTRYSFFIKVNGGLRIGASGGSFQNSIATAVLDGQWHTIMATSGSTTGSIIFYLDGEVVAQDTLGAGTFNVQDTALIIGGFGLSDPFDFVGKIDDVRIYSRILDADEAKEIHQLGCLDAMTSFGSAYYKEYIASRSGYFNELNAGSITANDGGDIKTSGTFVTSAGEDGITQSILITDFFEMDHNFTFVNGILVSYSEDK